jgi:hypothetical protein
MSVLPAGTIWCGNDPAGPDLNPDFMVGHWLATSLAMTSALRTLPSSWTRWGAVFTLSVQPSGRYTAILEGLGQSGSEIWKLTVDGIHMVFLPDSATLRQVLIPN